MKKLLLCLLICFIAFSAAACGGEKTDAITTEAPETTAMLKPDENGRITLKIFVDTVSVEAFGGKGEAVISAMIYPDASGNGISVSGDAKIVSLNIRPAK